MTNDATSQTSAPEAIAAESIPSPALATTPASTPTSTPQTLDDLAHLATDSMVRVLNDPEATASMVLRAAAALLRYVTTERNRAERLPEHWKSRKLVESDDADAQPDDQTSGASDSTQESPSPGCYVQGPSVSANNEGAGRQNPGSAQPKGTGANGTHGYKSRRALRRAGRRAA